MVKKGIILLSILFIILLFSSCETKFDQQEHKSLKQLNSIEQTPENKETPLKQFSESPVATTTPQATAVPIAKDIQVDLESSLNKVTPLLVIKEKIDPSLPEYLFKIFGEKKGSTIFANKIEILKTGDKEEKIQEIVLNDARTLDDKQIGVCVEDMNFDGFKDIRVQCGTPPGPNIPYYYWIWDAGSSKYVQSLELEKLTSPQFDSVNKVITSFNRGSAMENRESEYKYINNKLTLIKETERVGTPEIKGWHVTVKELINNEFIVTKKYDESSN